MGIDIINLKNRIQFIKISVENIIKSRLLKTLVQILVFLFNPQNNFVNLILLIFIVEKNQDSARVSNLPKVAELKMF